MKKLLSVFCAAAVALTMTGCSFDNNERNDPGESKIDSKTESKVDSKTDSKTESKTDSKTDNNIESDVNLNANNNIEIKNDNMPENKPENDAEPGSEKYNKTREAIIEYINTDLVKIAETESKMLTSYSSVSGTNYTNDLAMYNELTNTTIPTAKQLNQEAIELANKITDPELLMVHKKYLEYTSGLVSAFGIMTTALKKQDITMVTTANEKLTGANNSVMDYKAELTVLAEKYDVELG